MTFSIFCGQFAPSNWGILHAPSLTQPNLLCQGFVFHQTKDTTALVQGQIAAAFSCTSKGGTKRISFQLMVIYVHRFTGQCVRLCFHTFNFWRSTRRPKDFDDRGARSASGCQTSSTTMGCHPENMAFHNESKTNESSIKRHSLAFST